MGQAVLKVALTPRGGHVDQKPKGKFNLLFKFRTGRDGPTFWLLNTDVCIVTILFVNFSCWISAAGEIILSEFLEGNYPFAGNNPNSGAGRSGASPEAPVVSLIFSTRKVNYFPCRPPLKNSPRGPNQPAPPALPNNCTEISHKA